MKKILFSILFAFIFVVPLAVHAGVPEAVLYLKTQTLDDWTAQALVAAGETIDPAPLQSFSGSSVTDYAKRIMALTAAQENPITYAGTDLVAGLKSFAQSGQLGDTSLLNDDAWGIMALAAVGTPASETLIKSSAQFLLDNQNTDGGWSWGVGFDSDTNDTAAVLMALADAGYTSSDSAIQNAIAYLAGQQNTDAGWPYQLPCFWPGCEISDSASVSWVVSALNKFNLDASSWTKSGVSPQDFLLSLQTGDSSFKWQAGDPAGSAAMSAYAVVALADKSYPVVKGNYLGGGGSGPTPLADLAIKFQENDINIIEGATVGLTVKLINHGPTMAQGVVAKINLPEGVDLMEASATDGSFSMENKQWTFIRFNNYAEAQLNLVIRAHMALANTIKMSVSAQELDFNLTNNETAVNLAVTATKVEAGPEPDPEVLGEMSYGCEQSVSSEAITIWLGRIVKPYNSQASWYIDPVSRSSHCLSDSAAAYEALEKYGLGITNADLARIPMGQGEAVTVEATEVNMDMVNRLSGRILLQVESLGEAWYVNPSDGLRYYLADGSAALAKLISWSININN